MNSHDLHPFDIRLMVKGRFVLPTQVGPLRLLGPAALTRGFSVVNGKFKEGLKTPQKDTKTLIQPGWAGILRRGPPHFSNQCVCDSSNVLSVLNYSNRL